MIHVGQGQLPWRRGESKRFRKRLHVEPVDIADVFELMRVVGQDVGAVRLTGALVQIVVLLHEALSGRTWAGAYERCGWIC